MSLSAVGSAAYVAHPYASAPSNASKATAAPAAPAPVDADGDHDGSTGRLDVRA
jgi:hypothetical protein